MVVRLISGTATAAVAPGYVKLAADDGLYTGLPGRQVKLDSTVHRAVIGDGQGLHTQLANPRHKLGNTTHTVE